MTPEEFKKQYEDNVTNWTGWLNKRLSLFGENMKYSEDYVKVAMSGLAKDTVELMAQVEIKKP